MGDTDEKYQQLGTDIFASFWFHRFSRGLKYRPGQLLKPNRSLSVPLLLKLISEVANRIMRFTHPEIKYKWVVFLVYIVISYVVSLRGVEGLLLGLEDL